jgi:hypothetical protein
VYIMDVDSKYSAYNLYTMDALMGAHMQVLGMGMYGKQRAVVVYMTFGLCITDFGVNGAGKTLNPGQRCPSQLVSHLMSTYVMAVACPRS